MKRIAIRYFADRLAAFKRMAELARAPFVGAEAKRELIAIIDAIGEYDQFVRGLARAPANENNRACSNR